MSGVKIIVRNDAGNLVQLANYIDRTGWEVTQNAEEGSVGISTLYMDDLDESIWTTLGYNVGGRRQIRLVDYDSNKIVHFGYTSRRAIRRRFDVYGNDLGRAWSIEIWDPNCYLQRRILTHHGAKRPRETDVERIQWLITAHEWDIVDGFEISTANPKTMSKSDYRGQTVGDVVADCAQQARKNYWLDIVDQGDGDRLTFAYGREPDYDSTLSISNDLADLSVSALSAGTTTLVYPPSNETEYQMDPTRVFSGIYGTWEKGAVYRHLQTTATQFERWDTAMQWPNIHEKDRAEDRANNMLERLADEDERIETHIIVPASQAHLVRAGMRIPLKLTHIPRLESYTDCRILARGLAPVGDGTRYRIPLVLEPIEATETPPVNSCSTALSSIVAANVDEGNLVGSGGIGITMNITPTAHVASFLFGVAEGYSGVNSTNDMVVGAGWTSIYHATTGSSYRPSAAFGYKAVADPSGATAFNATYQGPNFPTGKGRHYGMAVISIPTSATSPVQSKGGNTHTVTLDSPPTAGRMLVMGICTNVAEAPDEALIGPGWTLESQTVCSTVNGAFIWTRCVETGDGSVYGVINGGFSHDTLIAVAEVAIT